MIQTWIADVTPLLDEQICQTYYNRLPEWRKEKANKLKGLKKAQSVGVWALYQRMQEFYGCCDLGVYNLSHSGRYALCAVETETDRDTKLGCDVEMIKNIRPEVARRFFCSDEEAYIMKQKTKERQAEEFYRYWVLKESFIKAVRKGLKLDLRSFEIRIEDGEPILVRQPEEYPEKYYYKEYELRAKDAKCAVCSTASEFGDLEFASFIPLNES